MPKLRYTLVLLLLVLPFSTLIAQGPPRRTAYVSSCGSDIPWVGDFETAKKMAKKEKKPIFWFVPTAYRTSMDRKQELYWNMMAGPFSDPVVVRYINERYIPLRLGFTSLIRRGSALKTVDRKIAKELAEKYGLVQGKFIEPGFVILDKNAKLVHTVDRFLLYQRTWFLNRMDQIASKNKNSLKVDALAASSDAEMNGPIGQARKSIGEGNVSKVIKAVGLIGKDHDGRAESRWLLGVCHHMQNETSRGFAVWKELIEEAPESIWAKKAQTELDGWGPFMWGFESYRDFPERVMKHKDLRHSRVAGFYQDESKMVARGLRRLLDLQREDGSWSDSRYDFGGLDSLPNVHMAVTAIAARGLLEWRDAGPKDLIDRALKRAMTYMADESKLNPKDKDEYIWAFVYRINFYSRLIEMDPQRKEELMPFLQKMVTETEAQQLKSGAYRHEYAAAFTSASVLHSLFVASEAGADLAMPRLKAATESVLGARVKKTGAFGYGTRGRGSVEASAGRMPLCELALYLGGKSSSKKLKNSVAKSFERHADFETARNYDDHMRSLHSIGGFFFWYDMHGRAEAINRLSGKKATEFREKMRQMVYSTNEADGGWIDSHEVGKSYGTAMALTVLKLMKDLKQ